MGRELDIIRSVLALATGRRDLDAAARDSAIDLSRPDGFVSFRYSRTEITSYGGHTHVKQTSTRFADGALTSEELEGTLSRDTYDDMVMAAQRQFMRQAAEMMRLFYRPFWLGNNDREE